MKLLNTSRSAGARAFTIIEIALCLGIIGFALVAIIAVLPRGLDVQKRNREETIVGQDADVWMNAIRSGAKGYDDLTNYVICITNIWTRYDANLKQIATNYDYYTPSNSRRTSINPGVNDFPLTNGAHIIGLLTMPKIVPPFLGPPTGNFLSNYVIVYARAFSGAAVDKPPQVNSTVLGDAFIYRMIVENFQYAPLDTNAIRFDAAGINGLTQEQLVERTNFWNTQWLLLANAHDFRLRFRWPVLPSGQIPNYGLATFRSMEDGLLIQTNDPDPAAAKQPLYFVQSSTYETNAPP